MYHITFERDDNTAVITAHPDTLLGSQLAVSHLRNQLYRASSITVTYHSEVTE